MVTLCFYATSANLFIDDGVLVEEKGDLLKISGFWTVVVTIQPQQPPDQWLWLLAEHTWRFIQDHGADLDEQAVGT